VSDPDAIEPLPDPRRITPQPASLDDPGKVVDVRNVVNRGRQGSTSHALGHSKVIHPQPAGHEVMEQRAEQSGEHGRSRSLCLYPSLNDVDAVSYLYLYLKVRERYQQRLDVLLVDAGLVNDSCLLSNLLLESVP